MIKISIILINILVLLTVCTDFPTSFDRIDSDEVRLLDFIYDPPEASPGDTVKVKAVFSGKKFESSDIKWSYSNNKVSNKYGSDTVFYIQPLTTAQEDYFSDNTTCYSFQFVVPTDLFKTHGQVSENWTELLNDSLTRSLPSSLTSLSKSQLIEMVDLLTISPQMFSAVSAQLNLPVDTLSFLLPYFSQLFTVQLGFFADVSHGINVESHYSVRYHSRFSKIPQIPVHVNHNPRIDSIGIYKVQGNKNTYDPRENKHTFMRIDNGDNLSNVLKVEDNYSYFLVAFHDVPDTFQTLYDLLDGTSHLEKLSTIWFFQHNDNETRNISSNNFMSLNGRESKNFDINSPITYYDLQSICRMFEPSDKSIKSVNVWCQVQDNTDNEIFHPVGSSLKEGSFTFQY